MKVRLTDGRDEVSLEYNGVGYAVTKEGVELPDAIAMFFVGRNPKLIEVVKEDVPDAPGEPGGDDGQGTPDENE